MIEVKKEVQRFTQEGLIQSQLPKYLQRLLDEEAEIEAVYLSQRWGLGGRFSVAYRHDMEIDTELYC